MSGHTRMSFKAVIVKPIKQYRPSIDSFELLKLPWKKPDSP